MLIIKPIENKNDQEQYALMCGVPYRMECLAYAAYVSGEFVGISQFSVSDQCGTIYDLVTKPTVKDSEALFIMGRQTMNWIDLLGIHTCRIRKDATPHHVMLAMGFTAPEQDGYIWVNMDGMFDGHCTGNCNIATLLKDE